jgi:AI-2 transport protein TqsA
VQPSPVQEPPLETVGSSAEESKPGERFLPGLGPKFTGYRLLVGAASAVIVGAGMVQMRAILAPFLFALLVAIAGALPLRWLQNKRVPGPLAALIVATLFCGVLLLLGGLAAQSVEGFTEALPGYRSDFEALFSKVQNRLQPYGVEIPSRLSQVDERVAMGILTSLLQGVARSFSSVATAVVILVFLLLEAADYRVKFRAALSHTVDVGRLEKVTDDVQRYLFVKTLTSAVTGALIWLLCSVVGVDFPVLWGLVAFVLNYIPVVGSIIAAVPAVLLGCISLSWFAVLGLAIGYGVVNTAVSNFLEPQLMGRHLGLSPLIVFMSLVFWGWAWGPIGMFLSVPITMLIKILLENSDDLRWVATLMGSARSLKREGRLHSTFAGEASQAMKEPGMSPK